jgi:hypothetical protein
VTTDKALFKYLGGDENGYMAEKCEDYETQSILKVLNSDITLTKRG